MNNSIDTNALYKLEYGLFVITSNDGVKDNAMINNTVFQVANNPNKIAVSINKKTYSHDVIKNSGIMNVNCLTEDAPFSLFEKYGFKSGRDTNKFSQDGNKYAENNLIVLQEYINSYISLKVVNYSDLGSHGLFICEITEAKVLNDDKSMSYSYYHENVKPKKADNSKKGFICKICGYVYEGEELPQDFICPLCKHGAEDFEPIE